MRTGRFERLRRDQRGAVGPLLALSFVPFLIFGGLAIDFGRALSVKTHLQAAADSAVLAAARVAGNANEDGSTNKELLVNKYIATNFAHRKGIKTIVVNVSEQDNKLVVDVKAKVATTVSAIMAPSIAVTAHAVARTADVTAPMCAVSLNPVIPEAFKIWGTADVNAPSCAMISNSSSASGMVSGGNASATAGLFCSAGGSQGGGFSPPVQSNCPTAGDPYVNKFTAAAILANTGINVLGPCMHNGATKISSNRTFTQSGANAYNFCGGLEISNGATVTLSSGIFVISGELLVRSHARLVATAGTTIYFAPGSASFNQGSLTVQAGASFQLKAPDSGYLNGIALVQPVVTGYSPTMSKPVVHTIIGGGIVDIVGIVYTPQATIRVTGNGTINPNSQFFSMISDKINIEGNGELKINNKSDYNFYGMTPLSGFGSNDSVSLAE